MRIRILGVRGLIDEAGERTIIKDMVKKAVERRNRVEFEEERQFRVGVRVNQNKIIEMGVKKENLLNEIVKR